MVNYVLWLPYLVKRTADVVNYVLWLPYLVKEQLMQAKNDDDIHGGQMSTDVKYSKLCSLATKLCQNNC